MSNGFSGMRAIAWHPWPGRQFIMYIMMMIMIIGVTAPSQAAVIYTYEFSATSVEGYTSSVFWRYHARSAIATPTVVAADDLQKCTVVFTDPALRDAYCGSIYLDPSLANQVVSTSFLIPLGGGSVTSDFAQGSFSSRGVHLDLQNTPGNCTSACRYATLTVRAVPEPGLLPLLGLGVAGLLVARRRGRPT